MIKFGTGGWREIIADGFSRGGRGGPDRLRLPALLHQPLLPHAEAPTTSQAKDFIAGWKEFLGI